MNLERLPNEEKLSLCRKYYLGGFAFLPFLWLVNVVWFFREAFVKPAYTEQLQIKTYVKRSAFGLLLWVAVLTTWITIFQHFRAEWGEVGDYLSFTIPLGIPWEWWHIFLQITWSILLDQRICFLELKRGFSGTKFNTNILILLLKTVHLEIFSLPWSSLVIGLWNRHIKIL